MHHLLLSVLLSLSSAATGVHAAWDSTIHKTVAPTAPPTITSEPWRCVTENATHFFKPPLPTSGPLFSAIDSYVEAQMAPCLKTVDPANMLYGCYPSKEAWCGITTAMPKSLLPAWSSLGSSASSFWAAKSSAAVSLAKQCPLRWYDASLGVPGGASLLNETIILSACYEEALRGTGTATLTPTRVSTTSTRTGTTATGTTTKNAMNGREAPPEVWMVVSTGIAVAAMGAAM
ncbi:hypothetical protein V8F20_005980 [Naviculisporaceae sp. PSN 640]